MFQHIKPDPTTNALSVLYWFSNQLTVWLLTILLCSSCLCLEWAYSWGFREDSSNSGSWGRYRMVLRMHIDITLMPTYLDYFILKTKKHDFQHLTIHSILSPNAVSLPCVSEPSSSPLSWTFQIAPVHCIWSSFEVCHPFRSYNLSTCMLIFNIVVLNA